MAVAVIGWVLGAALAPASVEPVAQPPGNSATSSAPAAPPHDRKPPVVEPPVVEPPVLVDAAVAQRPPQRPEQWVEVLLALEIDAQGRVVSLEVVESGGEAFDLAAIEAVKRFVFTPATEAGVPIAVAIQYRYVFEPVPVEVPDTDTDPGSTQPAIDDAEVVVAPRVDAEATAESLSAERAERVAGAQGDAIKATQTLAGVARNGAAQGELSVWGAAVSDSRRYIDGIVVPRLFHLGGSRSVVPSTMLDAVELVPGGFGPAYGRAIGGNVHAHTREARPLHDPHRVGGVVHLDTLDAAAGVDARVHERVWVAANARRSLLAHTYGAVAPERTRRVVPIPEYWDYQAKAVIRLSAHDELTVLGLGAHDRVERRLPSLTPELAFSEQRQAAFGRGGLRLTRTRPDGPTTTVTAWAGVDRDEWSQHFADVTADSDQRTILGGLRIDQRRRLASFAALRWGLDLELAHHDLARRGALSLPAREGDRVVFGQPPGDRVGEDAWRVTEASAAAYGAVRFFWGQGWSVEPGVRVEPLVRAGDRRFVVRPIEPELGFTDVDVAVDPRLSVRWAPRDAIALFAAGGRYHQNAAAADRSPRFGNPRLAPVRAYHAVLGAQARPWWWLDLRVTGFFTRAQRIAGRNPSPTPSVAEALQSRGHGRNTGVQLRAQFEPHPSVFGALVYSLMWAQRRDPGATGWRSFDREQRHVGTAVLGWTHRTGVELGGRLSMSSGVPRTAVVGAVANARTGGFDPIFGPHNADQLPMFVSASVRVGWGRTWKWGSLRTWLDVQNVTHRRNAEEWFYTSDFSQRGTVDGLPILPVVGVQVRR